MSQTEILQAQQAIQMFKEALLAYGYNDFIEGDEPYILLEESAITAENRARFQVLLEKHAQQCGVPIRVVRSIIKERQNSLANNQPEPTEPAQQFFAFGGQPLALCCGKYQQSGNAITMEDKYGSAVICPHPLIPTKRYVNIETGTESLEISFKREHWKSIIVEKGKLANASTITQLADHGISVTSETAREMVKYISYIDDLNRGLIPIEQMSSHLGWVSDTDFVPYVEGVEYDGQGAFLQMYKTIHEKGDYQKWLDAVKAIRAAGCVQARIVIAASFASVLLPHFEALPFFVHLWSAQSGTGKTVTMEVAASIWADPAVGAYCRPLKSTSVGLEQLAIFTCNLPLCLDELQTIQGKGNFDDIIYGLCEGSGKTRGARNGGLRHSPSWRNTIITTGEMPIVSGGSKAGAMNRVIEIECKGATMPDAKAMHKVVTANYGHAGRRFIAAVTDKLVMHDIEDDQQAIFDRLSEIGTDKQALSASILLAADHAAEQIIFRDGVRLTEADILPYLRTDTDVDSGRRAHEYLLEWIAGNHAGFVVDGDYEAVRAREVLGCMETDKDNGDATKIWVINKVFNQALIDGGFSPDSYLSWAQGQGLIQLDKGGQRKVNKHIPGSGVTARCACLLLGADKKSMDKWEAITHDADLPWQ